MVSSQQRLNSLLRRRYTLPAALLVGAGIWVASPCELLANDLNQIGDLANRTNSSAPSVKLVTDPSTGQPTYVPSNADPKTLPTNTSFMPTNGGGGFDYQGALGGSSSGGGFDYQGALGSVLGGSSSGGGFDYQSALGGILGGSNGGGGFGGFNMNTIFGSVLGRYRNMFGQMIDRYRQTMLGDALGSIISENMGDLGILDPDQYGTEVAEKVWGSLGQRGQTASAADAEIQKVDRFNWNPSALAQSLTHEGNRLAARTMANTVLTQEGQQAMANEMEAAEQSLQMIRSTGESAQSLDVTQDVMKELAKMTVGQAQLQSGTYAQLMLVRQQLAASNQVLADTSESLDEANRARKAELIGGAAAAARGAATLYLPGMPR